MGKWFKGLRKAGKWIDHQASKVYKYHERHPKTVLAKIQKAIMDAGLSANISTNTTTPLQNIDANLKIGNLKLLETNIIEPQIITDDSLIVNKHNNLSTINELLEHRQQNNKNRLSIEEPTIYELYNNSIHPLIDNIISQCLSELIPGGGTIWEGSKIYGALLSKTRTPLIATFFADAETSIANWCYQNPNSTEIDFRNKIEVEIDFAYERSLQICDTY